MVSNFVLTEAWHIWSAVEYLSECNRTQTPFSFLPSSRVQSNEVRQPRPGRDENTHSLTSRFIFQQRDGGRHHTRKFHPLLFSPQTWQASIIICLKCIKQSYTQIYYFIWEQNLSREEYFIECVDAAKISTCNFFLFLEVLIGFATSENCENWSDLEKIK